MNKRKILFNQLPNHILYFQKKKKNHCLLENTFAKKILKSQYICKLISLGFRDLIVTFIFIVLNCSLSQCFPQKYPCGKILLYSTSITEKGVYVAFLFTRSICFFIYFVNKKGYWFLTVSCNLTSCLRRMVFMSFVFKL